MYNYLLPLHFQNWPTYANATNQSTYQQTLYYPPMSQETLKAKEEEGCRQKSRELILARKSYQKWQRLVKQNKIRRSSKKVSQIIYDKRRRNISEALGYQRKIAKMIAITANESNKFKTICEHLAWPGNTRAYIEQHPNTGPRIYSKGVWHIKKNEATPTYIVKELKNKIDKIDQAKLPEDVWNENNVNLWAEKHLEAGGPQEIAHLLTLNKNRRVTAWNKFEAKHFQKNEYSLRISLLESGFKINNTDFFTVLHTAPGLSLHSILFRRTNFTNKDKEEIFIAFGQKLAKMHFHGKLAHLDLNSPNIYVQKRIVNYAESSILDQYVPYDSFPIVIKNIYLIDSQTMAPTLDLDCPYQLSLAASYDMRRFIACIPYCCKYEGVSKKNYENYIKLFIDSYTQTFNEFNKNGGYGLYHLYDMPDLVY